jgi:hypothetical protein
MHHHSPIVYIARLGTKWLIAALLLSVLFNPVTWGIGLALYDHFSHSDAGARFLGGK